MKNFTLLFLVPVFLGFMREATAQDLKGNNWYFGNSQEAIRFNKSNNDPNLLNNQAIPFGTGGSAVATDPITGDLLFYTDGDNVYDASHTLMTNGSGLGAKTDINQPVAISPVPGMPGQYYIFSNNPSESTPYIYASIVDMNLAGNAAPGEPSLGAVISKHMSTGVLSTSSAMAVISGGDPFVYNLLTQDNNALRSFQIENTLPFAGPTNSVSDFQTSGNFAYNKVDSTIAVVPESPNANIKIYQFFPSTGAFSILDTIQNSAKTGELLYDAAWSPDGKVLYFSRSSVGNATTGQIYQYHDGLTAPQAVLDAPVYRSYGLQTGPDGKLYHLYLEENNSIFKLGRINNPNQSDSLVYAPWQEDVNFNGRQFPQFTPQEDFAFDLVTFEVADTCANSRTKFSPKVVPLADSLIWTIADTVINSFSPELTFEQGGVIPVKLTAYLNGQDSTYTRNVTINQNDLQIQLPSDTTVCASAFPGFQLTAQLSGGTGGEQLVWSNGQIGETATFDSTGTYYVVAENANGCKAYASVNIKICQEEKRVGNIWFFGEQAGIDFNPEEPVALPDSSQMSTPAGASAISDRNGQILFYTNGSTVWNREHEVMKNGTNIGGDSLSTQSSLIVPFPGDATKYYIFTTDVANGDQTYDLRYSIVDIKGDGTKGEVEPTSKGTLLFSKSTEKITAVEKGDTTWLLMHELGNNTFRAYPISSGGIGGPILSSVGSDHTSGNAGNAKGYMKFSTNGKRVAAAVQGPPGFVELFNFNDTTGIVSDSLRIDFGNEQPYGIEFSPDNEKLYISTASALYQYHINDTLTREEILDSKKSIETNSSGTLGALQIGPNGQIYLAQDGVSEVLVVNGPNTLETDTSHVSISPFPLEGPNSRLGLPNFVQSIMEPPSEGNFDFVGQCLGDETQFTATGRCDTDQFEWVIKNAQNQIVHRTTKSKATETYFEFPEPGVYDVSLIISNPCIVPADTTITKDITIFAPPAEPEYPTTIGLCGTAGETLTAGPVAPDSLAYLWSTGATENEIIVTQPGTYSVIITNLATGCTTEYTTEAENAGPEVELGDDLFYCQGDEELRFSAGNPGSTYAWEVMDTENGTIVRTGDTQIFGISTATPGTFEYKVTVTAPAPFNCVTKDSVLVTINPSPQGAAAGNSVTSCADASGEVILDITSMGNYAYEVFDAQNNLLNAVASVAGPVSGISAATNLGPGLYYIMLTDNVSGCETRLDATIINNDPGQFQINTITPIQADCNGEGTISATLTGGPVSYPGSYILSGTTTEGDLYSTSPPGSFNAATININNVPPGTYVLEVTDATGCKATTEVVVEAAEEVPLDIFVQSENCVEDLSNIQSDEYAVAQVLNADEGVFTYTWVNETTGTTEGIVGGQPNGAVKGIQKSGRYTVTAARISDPTCTSDTTIEISFSEAPELEFTFGEDCMGERTVTVTPTTGSGSYAYLWSTGAQTNTITANASGFYSVQVFDRVTGCVANQSTDVTVNPEVTVNLFSIAACANEDSITLFTETTPDHVTYFWQDGNGNILEQGINLDTIRVSKAGTYSVTVSREGCSATDEITVQRNAVGRSTLPEAEVIICPSSADPKRSEIYLNPDSLNSFTRYRWERDDEFISSEKIIKPMLSGEYRVTMTNIDGCIVEDVVQVLLSCQPVLFVPNAIRPGSNIGENRAFKIFTEDAIADEGFQVYIFNRWGEMVFQSKDKDFEWDGTFNGNLVPVGAYSYVIYYKGEGDPSDEVYQLQGGVTVLR